MDLLKKCLEKWNIDIDDDKVRKFTRYYELLIEWNKKINLTSIVEKDDVVVKHFVDSIALIRFTDLTDLSVIDVGTGAGFPGIPLKIMVPDCNIVLLDSLNKRIGFLQNVIEELGLEKIETVHGRAEDTAHVSEHREKYDIVLSRAVANLSTLSEYCLPFVKDGGIFVSYKSGNSEEEINGSDNALSKLGGIIERVEKFSLPGSDYDRSLVFVKKIKKTPSCYPRKAGTPSRKPL